MPQTYDVIIVGAGHNGLVAAGYLARAGLKTLVLESRYIVGGACVTEEVFPGYKVSTTSYLCSLLHEKIIKDLELPRFGYHVFPKNPAFFSPFPDDRYLILWSDTRKTCDEFRKFSARDAENYVRYEEFIDRLARFVEPLLLETAPDIAACSCAAPAHTPAAESWVPQATTQRARSSKTGRNFAATEHPSLLSRVDVRAAPRLRPRANADRLPPQKAAPMPKALEAARRIAGQLTERGERLTSSLTSRIRPRVSLASGSILVLLTLFLPIGYNACGGPNKGYELIQGNGEWPSFLGVFVSSTAGQDFYGVVLLLAVLTAIFVLLSGLNPKLSRRRPLPRRLFLLAGTVSLFLISDLFLTLIGYNEPYSSLALALGLVAILTPGLFWPRKMFWGWLSAVAISISLAFIAQALNWPNRGGTRIGMDLLFLVTYCLVPLGLWWRLNGIGRADWNPIRTGLVAFYFPAVVANLVYFNVARKEGVWGMVPCYFGIHLITLGYMRLAKEVEERRAETTAT